ncbi:MAG: lamin tail domain-containing protein [Bacteroidales bacterium]|nr:lamin tail domain-containing protein [Bacteroidales bacterium]
MQGIPLNLQAIPSPGYVFTGWKEINTVDAEIDLTLDEAFTLTATFAQSEEGYTPLVITEIMYHPIDNEEEEWIEIYNPNSTPVDLSLWQLKDAGVNNLYVIPQGTTVDANNFYVICHDIQEFKRIYPDVTNVVGSFGDGNMGFKLSNSSDNIFLINDADILEDQVNYSDSNPWTSVADGSGPSLQLKDYNLDNNEAINWESRFYTLSTPGTSNNSTTSIDTPIDQGFNVYPNPITEGSFEMSLSNVESVILSIYDITGQSIYSENFSSLSGEKVISVDLPTLSSGIYILTVSVDNKTSYTRRIVYK